MNISTRYFYNIRRNSGFSRIYGPRSFGNVCANTAAYTEAFWTRENNGLGIHAGLNKEKIVNMVRAALLCFLAEM